jgi:hypothetical protein
MRLSKRPRRSKFPYRNVTYRGVVTSHRNSLYLWQDRNIWAILLGFIDDVDVHTCMSVCRGFFDRISRIDVYWKKCALMLGLTTSKSYPTWFRALIYKKPKRYHWCQCGRTMVRFQQRFQQICRLCVDIERRLVSVVSLDQPYFIPLVDEKYKKWRICEISDHLDYVNQKMECEHHYVSKLTKDWFGWGKCRSRLEVAYSNPKCLTEMSSPASKPIFMYLNFKWRELYNALVTPVPIMIRLVKEREFIQHVGHDMGLWPSFLYLVFTSMETKWKLVWDSVWPTKLEVYYCLQGVGLLLKKYDVPARLARCATQLMATIAFGMIQYQEHPCYSESCFLMVEQYVTNTVKVQEDNRLAVSKQKNVCFIYDIG